ncbi:MAG: prepilin-type N-terminal cleavage/methylation domain-containing protein [candidate division NC10 bacterium]|nr:prepilin-type N-terminal cleavage/methylation domain-containing protein [candidate division NC10 bacterium]
MGNRGVTLIEIFVAILIVGVLAGLGIPSLLPLIRSSTIDGATRQVMYEIRAAQNLAVTRGDDFGFHWGGDPLVGMATSVYRMETDPTGACGWPAPTDTAATNPNVIRDWFDLSGEYQGITIQSVQDATSTDIGGVMFNSRGASMNSCVAVTFPLTITIADTSGVTRTIEVQRAGRVRII